MRRYEFLELLAWQKTYFDRGYGISRYLLVFVGLFGLASRDVHTTIVLSIAYALFAYAIGRVLVGVGFIEAEIEVNNKLNKFVKEVRGKINGRAFGRG